jgi:hypothetical protein
MYKHAIKLKSVSAIRIESAMGTPEEGPMTSAFMLQLNAFIASVALNGAGTNLNPELKLDAAGFMGQDRNALCSYTPMNKRLCLHFTGVVSRVPLKGSLLICKAFRTQFYVHAGPFASIGSDSYSPAWSVPVPKAAAPKLGRKAAAADAAAAPHGDGDQSVPVCPLAVQTTTVQFGFNYKARLVEKAFVVELTLCSLFPEDSFEPDEKETSQGYVALRRPVIKEQVAAPPAGKDAHSKRRSAAQVSAEDLQAQKQRQGCRHLVR